LNLEKITTKDYFFRHHLETSVDSKKELVNITFKRIGLNGLNGIVKLRINHIGQIIKVGEY
jgi:CRISPR-associated endonuclease Csn1